MSFRYRPGRRRKAQKLGGKDTATKAWAKGEMARRLGKGEPEKRRPEATKRGSLIAAEVTQYAFGAPQELDVRDD
ncbi:hypothetical protein MRX96_007390 [Rhipicephalus microplus]